MYDGSLKESVTQLADGARATLEKARADAAIAPGLAACVNHVMAPIQAAKAVAGDAANWDISEDAWQNWLTWVTWTTWETYISP